jgi:PadR family transcriptional regulator PadR
LKSALKGKEAKDDDEKGSEAGPDCFGPSLGPEKYSSDRGGRDGPNQDGTHGLHDIIALRNRMSKSKLDSLAALADRDLYSGLIRLHVLHHAAEKPIFGFGMMEELARHGYRISPGSLYPLLKGLEKKGYLRSTEQRNGKSLRKVYRATALGKRALAASKNKVKELFHELMEGD